MEIAEAYEERKQTGGVLMSATDILELLAGLNCGSPYLVFFEEVLRELNLVRQCLVGGRSVQASYC